MSKISIPLPKVSDTSSPQKKAHQAKTAPAAASKKVPIVASEAKQSKPIQQRSTKVKEPKQPVAPPQAKQVKATPPAASKKAPVVKGEVKQSAPAQQKGAKKKQPKQPTAPQQAKQANPAPPKVPAKATPTPVGVPKISDVPKLQMPPAVKKQPSPVKSAPPAASKKAPVVKGEVKQSVPPQQKGKKSKKPKQPKQPTVPQQAKQVKVAPPKAPAKATLTPVAVPKVSDVPKLKMPPAAKKQPSPVKSAPPAASKKAPVVKGEVKQSVPPQQKGKKSKKPKQSKQPTAPQQAKQANPAPPKAPAKATLTPVAVPKIVNVPKNTSLEGLDELDLGFMPLDQLQEKLKQLIQEVLADPSHESFMLYFSFEKSDWEAFVNWYKAFDREFSYPHSVMLVPYPKELPSETLEEDRIYKACALTNYTKRENDARTLPVHFFGKTLDKRLMNSNNVYNLLVRSGLQSEHFQKGRFGFTEKVFCKSIQLKHNESVEAAQSELRAKIDEELLKVGTKTKTRDINYQYVVLVFQLPKRDDLPFYQINIRDPRNPNFARDNLLMAQIHDNSEHRIYVCLKNEARLVIDLHDHSVNEALDKVEDFVLTKWERYEESCEIITGAGNHSARGFSILKKEVRAFLKSPDMVPYVQKVKQLGTYKFEVLLRQPKLCDLTKLAPNQDPVEVAKAALAEAALTDNPRVRFLANNIHSVWPRLYIKGVYMSFDFHGENELRVEIQEPSDESESTEDVSE